MGSSSVYLCGLEEYLICDKSGKPTIFVLKKKLKS